jgi:UDP-glucose 4-epimerase
LWQIPPLTVYGNDYKTKDGTGIRDYIHVMDLAEAHLKAYEYLVDIEKTQKSDSKVWFFDIYNVGTGEWTSVMQMIDLVKKVTEKNVPYTIWPRRDGDVAVSLCNPQKIEKNLARKAKRTIRQAIQDHRNFIKKRYPS